MASAAFNAAFQNWQNPISQLPLSGDYSVPGYASGGGINPNQNFMMPDIGAVGEDGSGGLFAGTSLADKVGLGIGGLQALSNLWLGMKSLNMAKKDFAFRKGAFNTNLANQVKSYNTTLEDRIRARAHVEGRDSGYADKYLDKHSLEDRKL